MFLQVWPSGSSHEEAHLERGEQQPSNAAKGKVFKGKRKNKNKRRLPTSLLVELSQSRVAGVCSSQSMPFCTILKPSASGTSLWRKALWRLSVATRGQNHGCGRNRFDWEGLTHKKTKKERKKTQTKRVNDLCVWCMMFWGHLPDSRYTGTLENCLRWACVHCECLRLADWPPGRREEDSFVVGRRGRIDGWCGASADVAVDWMGFWGKRSTCVSPGGSVRMGQDGSSCLSVWHLDWGRGALQCFWGLGFNQIGRRWIGLWPRDQNPLPRSLYDRSFFWCFWCSY